MNTETTEKHNARGWIFYDADCPACQSDRRTWGKILAKRGFDWVPLQMTGAAMRLGLPPAALLDEMKLLLPDRRVLGGMESWIHLSRSVWWLWPLGTLLSVPGLHALGRASYRWLARHRHGVRGESSNSNQPRHRTIPFLDLP